MPSPQHNKYLIFKIDVDTYEGMRDGVPRLLKTLYNSGLKATFCLSFGPDNSGKAIFKLFKDPKFLKKMLKTGAPRLYGWRTILSGTLIPARNIALSFPDIVKKIDDEGHEIIVHAWNHRYWQDHLNKMDKNSIRNEFNNAFNAYKKILNQKAHAVAAPGWQATPLSLEVEDELELLYASDLRAIEPCFLSFKDKRFKTLQIPTTGLCIEELLTIGIRDEKELKHKLITSVLDAPYPVMAVHAEVEGGVFNKFFEHEIIPYIKGEGYKVITLSELAYMLLKTKELIPTKRLCWKEIQGRAGKVASSC